MIIVTGAAGFIGSCLISKLNKIGFDNIIAVDHFGLQPKNGNLVGKKIQHFVERDQFFSWAKKSKRQIDFLFHLGARTDTLENNTNVFEQLNLRYSKDVWRFCVNRDIPLIYASSAATYGVGEFGYSVDYQTTQKLVPLNEYARSKHKFDLWVLEQRITPPIWTGLKFFNVFGPNEYHKGKMASMVYQAYSQIKRTGKVQLFKSYMDCFEHGGQKRDFIYVNDIVALCIELMNSSQSNQILNAGTGKAQDFNFLIQCIFKVLHKPKKVEYIEMPIEIREKYQYNTKADITVNTNLNLSSVPQQLEKSVDEYVNGYLEQNLYY